MGDTTIIRKALGRTAALGDLYDATSDTFTGFSLLSTPLPPELLETIVNPSSKFDYLYSNRQDEKIKKCEVEAELAVSVLCGIVSVSGQGRYLTDQSETDKEVSASLLYSVSTKTDRFNVFNGNVKPLISIDALNNCKHATHAVVGIDYGANATVVLKHINKKNDEKTKIQGELSGQLQVVVSSISLSGKADISQSLNASNLDYTLHFYADVSNIDQQLPTTIEDAIAIIKQIPKMIENENNGRGKPLSFVLIPISVLNGYVSGIQLVDRMVKQIEYSVLDDILRIFSDLNEANVKLNDLKELFTKNEEWIPADKKRTVLMKQAILKRTESTFRYQIAECLKEVRAGRKDAFELDLIKETFNESFSIAAVEKFLDDMKDTVQKIRFINDVMKENAIYVGKTSSFEEARRAILPDNEYYVLFFSSTYSSSPLYSQNMHLFYVLLREHKTRCLIADLDVLTDAAQREGVPEGPRICHFLNGAYINFDYFTTFNEERMYCLMKSVNEMEYVQVKPNKRVEIKFVCPGSIGSGKCNKEKQQWLCVNCKYSIEYGFDDMFYCNCGRGKTNTFKFRCNDWNHGNEYVQFSDEILALKVKEIQLMPELNILVLGETGVGKSTWINAVANYLTFPTLKEADEAKDILCLIPTKFTILDNFTEKVVSIGSSKNESKVTGQASTQFPMAHLFYVDDYLIRIIDTPGIGDPRGVEQDKINLDNILRYVSIFNEVHGICILLKPNNARLHTYFRFCILEMLSHLNKSAVSNIMFCFTNTRGTFYKAGDTYPALKALLDDINANLQKTSPGLSDVEITLSTHTMYCLDNEAFRFLCARRCNIEFSEKDFLDFQLSWDKSMTETNRMLEHIKSVKPHRTIETISVNKARQIIFLLAKPMARITDNIATNIRVSNEQRHTILTLREEELELIKNRMMDDVKISTKNISYPKTVCTSCVSYQEVTGKTERMTIYNTECHERCYLTGVHVDTVGAAPLRHCSAMNGNYCRHCGCHWTKHMHITYEFIQEHVRVVDPKVEKDIAENTNYRTKKEQMIAALDEKVANLKIEQERILTIGSKFGSFLKRHSIRPYNDAFEAHVRHELDLAQKDVTVSKDSTKVNALTKLLEEYAEKKKLLDDLMEDSHVDEITVDDVSLLKNELMSLMITGDSFKQAFEVAEGSAINLHQSMESPVRIRAREKTVAQKSGWQKFWDSIKLF